MKIPLRPLILMIYLFQTTLTLAHLPTFQEYPLPDQFNPQDPLSMHGAEENTKLVVGSINHGLSLILNLESPRNKTTPSNDRIPIVYQYNTQTGKGTILGNPYQTLQCYRAFSTFQAVTQAATKDKGYIVAGVSMPHIIRKFTNSSYYCDHKAIEPVIFRNNQWQTLSYNKIAALKTSKILPFSFAGSIASALVLLAAEVPEGSNHIRSLIVWEYDHNKDDFELLQRLKPPKGHSIAQIVQISDSGKHIYINLHKDISPDPNDSNEYIEPSYSLIFERRPDGFYSKQLNYKCKHQIIGNIAETTTTLTKSLSRNHGAIADSTYCPDSEELSFLPPVFVDLKYVLLGINGILVYSSITGLGRDNFSESSMIYHPDVTGHNETTAGFMPLDQYLSQKCHIILPAHLNHNQFLKLTYIQGEHGYGDYVDKDSDMNSHFFLIDLSTCPGMRNF